jgi:uncharacterized membrane protein
MTKHRLELFSDGVFAIVLTLLVLDLKVPSVRGLAGVAEIAPALLVHAVVFFLVGVLWMVHHGALERVIEIAPRTLLLNLLSLFWVTLLPFAAKNAAEHPLEPLGASLMTTACGAYLASIVCMRLSTHSAIDDNAAMRPWRAGRLRLGLGIAMTDAACAALSWVSPWFGYVSALATVVILLVLPTPQQAEQKIAGKPG